MQGLTVRLPGTSRGAPLDARHALGKSGGLNVSPPLVIEDVPPEARSLAFMLVDRDAADFVHWLVTDLPAAPLELAEGASGEAMPAASNELYTTAESVGYYGPNPPPRSGKHRYELVAYALDVDSLDVSDHADAATFDAKAAEHAVAIGSNYWMFENR